MNVGFLGLGRMGRGMAHRVLTGGHDLVVYDVVSTATESLTAAGARAAASIQDACAGRDVVITMLVEDVTVLDAVQCRHGIRDSLPDGSVHLAMGTYGVDAVRTLTRVHDAAGQHVVAAPVLGRPELAAQGQLGIVAAGLAAQVKRCEPLLNLIGRRVFRAGAAPTAATAIKLANNHLLGCALVAMAEAFSLARRYGVPARLVYDLFASGGLNSAAYTGYGRTMVENGYDTVGSPITVGLKDALLIRAAAERVAVPMPSHNVYRDRLLGAIAHGDGGRDQAVLAREQNRVAGIEDVLTQGAPGAHDVAQAAVSADAAPSADAFVPLFHAGDGTAAGRGSDEGTTATLALAHATLTACAVEAIAECFALVRKYDVNPRVMIDVMTDGLFRGSDVYRTFGTAMIAGIPVGQHHATVAEALQTLQAVSRAADAARVPMPSVDACRDRLLGSMAHGNGDRPWVALYREQLRASGLD